MDMISRYSTYISATQIHDAVQKFSKLNIGAPKYPLNDNSRFYDFTFVDDLIFDPVYMFSCENILLYAQGALNLVCDHRGEPVNLPAINLGYSIFYQERKKTKSALHLTNDNFVVDYECILLAGWAPHQWGHFMCEFFPRLLALKDFLHQRKDLPIFISEYTPTYIVESIRFVLHDCDPDIRFFTNNSYTKYLHAHVPSFLNSGPRKGYHPILSFLLDDLISTTMSVEDKVRPDVGSPSMLYFSRKHQGSYKSNTKNRTIVNEDDVIRLLRNKGFEIICMEDYSIEGKLRLLSNARLIVGGHGSGLLNSLLTNTCNTVCSIGYGWNSAVANACEIARQEYVEVATYDPENPSLVLSRIEGRRQWANLDLLEEVLMYEMSRLR